MGMGSRAELKVGNQVTRNTVSPTLEQMAEWLGLERVEVAPRGNLAKALRTHC